MHKTPTHPLSAVSNDITPDAAEPQTLDRLELISAYFDGEFEQSDTELLSSASPLATDLDPLEHKKDWALYALISDSLVQPSARVLSPSAEFSARLSAALQREPVHQLAVDKGQDRQATSLSQRAARPSAWSKWFSWPSLAMAAAVAAVVWVAQPLLMLDDVVVVATPTVQTQPSVDGAIVSDYANAHRQFSGPIAVRQASFEPGVDR
jgi:sigma-E factor negative regulatory protein RseA